MFWVGQSRVINFDGRGSLLGIQSGNRRGDPGDSGSGDMNGKAFGQVNFIAWEQTSGHIWF